MSYPNASTSRTVRRSESGDRKRVLFLTHRVPFPPDRGDRIRAFHILKFLSKRYDLSLAAVTEETVTDEQWQVMNGLADRVAVQPISPRWSKLRGLASLALGGAVSPAYFYRRELAKTIQQWNAQAPFDAVVTFCTGMIKYARAVIDSTIPTGWCPSPATTGVAMARTASVNGPVPENSELLPTPAGRERTAPPCRDGAIHIIDLVDVDSAKWAEYSRNSKAPMRWVYATEAKRLRRIEAGDRDRFDAVAVVSEAEANIYRKEVGLYPGLTVLRHAVDTDYFQPSPQADSQNLVFIGVLNYKPNVEGIIWFVKNVMPLLRQRLPHVKLQIIGRHSGTDVSALGNEENVEVVGSVPDVRPFLASAAASIAPLQIARGVQTKVLEAMASGRVAVCSPGAAEGIHGDGGEHLFICRSPEDWAGTLERVITNPQLRERIAANARQRIEDVYPWEKCYEPLVKLIDGPHPTLTQRRAA